MTITAIEIINLFLAVLVGGAIGLEREIHHKAAGFRTITLICIGSTLICMLDVRLSASGRIIANILTGIGFLGAGVILHDTSRIRGLTTAASVWVAAGLGIGIGSGAYLLSITAAIFVLVVMDLFMRFERRIDGMWDIRHYQMVFELKPGKVEQMESLLQASGMRVGLCQQMKVAGELQCSWDVSGTTVKQNTFVQSIINDPDVKEVKW